MTATYPPDIHPNSGPSANAPASPPAASTAAAYLATRNGQPPGRDRAQPLPRMPPVPLHVHDVVHQIRRARQRREDDQRERRPADYRDQLPEVPGVPGLVDREEDREIDQEVLGPLLRTRRHQQRPEHLASRGHRQRPLRVSHSERNRPPAPRRAAQLEMAPMIWAHSRDSQSRVRCGTKLQGISRGKELPANSGDDHPILSLYTQHGGPSGRGDENADSCPAGCGQTRGLPQSPPERLSVSCPRRDRMVTISPPCMK